MAGSKFWLSETVRDNHDEDHIPLETPPRSARIRQPNRRVFGDEWTTHTVQLTPTSRTMLGHIVPGLTHDDLFLHSLDWDAPFSSEYGSLHNLNLLHVDPFTNEVDWIHPFTLAAKLPPDEIELWYESMDIELQALRDKRTMTEINRKDVPTGKQIVKSTRAFKKKRRPNGEMYKRKSTFCIRGDLQILDNNDSTFSPVVDWSTVRLLFIICVALGMKSRTICTWNEESDHRLQLRFRPERLARTHLSRTAARLRRYR